MEYMTQEALVFMLGVWAIVIGFTSFCFYKLLTSKRSFDDHDHDRL